MWTCLDSLLKPISRQRSDLVFWFILGSIDCPTTQRWYEFTCSYLWNGMLVGRTWRPKHRRNGGKTSQRWGNIYAVWPCPAPPPTNMLKKNPKNPVFCLYNVLSECCVLLRNGPEGWSLPERRRVGACSAAASYVWLLWLWLWLSQFQCSSACAGKQPCNIWSSQ